MRSSNNRNLLKQANRPVELLVGGVCAVISMAFATLLVYLVYIVGWRNPRQYGSHDLLKGQTIGVFAVLLLIAIGFSVFAFRLLLKAKAKRRLMSPFVLRVWGAFFAVGSVVVFVDCVANRRWNQLPHLWEILTGSVAMAVAAFALAKRWQDNPPAI
jgi:hypothetical protein